MLETGRIVVAVLASLVVIYTINQSTIVDVVEVERDTDDQYEYDPYDTTDAALAPDKEGEAPPTPKWHACRFAAKKGGIYDIRPLSRNQKLLKAASSYFNNLDFPAVDWVHKDETIRNQTYYMNVCSDVHLVPPQCKDLQKLDPAPAFETNAKGECFYLGSCPPPPPPPFLAVPSREPCRVGHTY